MTEWQQNPTITHASVANLWHRVLPPDYLVFVSVSAVNIYLSYIKIMFLPAWGAGAPVSSWCNRLPNPAAGLAAAGTLLPHPRHSSSLHAHNLTEAADCTWRTLLHLSWSRQLFAGRRSTTDAHRSCLTRPDATYTWRRIPTSAILSPSGTGSNTCPPPGSLNILSDY